MSRETFITVKAELLERAYKADPALEGLSRRALVEYILRDWLKRKHA